MKLDYLSNETLSEILSYSVREYFETSEDYRSQETEVGSTFSPIRGDVGVPYRSSEFFSPYSREDVEPTSTSSRSFEKRGNRRLRQQQDLYLQLVNYASVCRWWRALIKYKLSTEIDGWTPSDFQEEFLNAARQGFLLIVEVALISNNAYLLKSGGSEYTPTEISTTPAVGFFGNDPLAALPHKTSFPKLRPALELEALNAAASQDRCSVVKLLLESGVDVNGTPLPGRCACLYTPLFLSALGLGFQSARLLLKWGANVNARTSENGLSPLFGAVGSGQCLRRRRNHDSMERQDGVGITAKSIAMTRLLLMCGADPTLVADLDETVLRLAASTGQCETIRLLLAAGAHKQLEAAPTFNNHTPLLVACSCGFGPAARLLLESGANVSLLSTVGGLDALGYAIKSDNRSMAQHDPHSSAFTIKALIEYGADIDGSEQTTPPLSQAVYWGNLPAINILLKAGANIEKIDHKGFTPLKNCLIYRTCHSSTATWMMSGDSFDGLDMDIFETLLHNGANTNRHGPDGPRLSTISLRTAIY